MPRMCGSCERKSVFGGASTIWTCKNKECGNYQIKAQVFDIRCLCVIDGLGSVVSACRVHMKWLAEHIRRYK
jgi:hypothetical protein